MITISIDMPEGALFTDIIEALKARRDFYAKTGRLAEAQATHVLYVLAKAGDVSMMTATRAPLILSDL